MGEWEEVEGKGGDGGVLVSAVLVTYSVTCGSPDSLEAFLSLGEVCGTGGRSGGGRGREKGSGSVCYTRGLLFEAR